jgi:acetyltransferase-like isoleucine patch superfamily enzyme
MAIIPKIRLQLFKLVRNYTLWKLRRLYGMHIGKGVRINRRANIDHTINPQGIYIGDYTGISDATIMAHDGLRLKKADTVIGKHCHIGYGAFINCGIHIGNGAIIAACAVVIKNVPPYAIVVGNPGKVVGFIMTPEEIVEYEKQQYPEEERIPLEKLQKNYKKYFLDRKEEIKLLLR